MKNKIPDVPEEFKQITDNAVHALESAANRSMWVTEMLGNDVFEVTTEKYKIVIKKVTEYDDLDKFVIDHKRKIKSNNK